MKNSIIVLSLLLLTFSVQSQETVKNKNAKVSFEVEGVCGMCKKRIETAALKTKGVKFATWSVDTHMLNLIMDERKTTLEEVQKNIVAVGHDVKDMKASDEAYNSVNPCCKYRDEKVVLEHKKN